MSKTLQHEEMLHLPLTYFTFQKISKSFQQIVLDIYMQKKKKMNLDTDLIPFTKITSKWIIGLSINCKIIKLLDGNIGENLDTTPKS